MTSPHALTSPPIITLLVLEGSLVSIRQDRGGQGRTGEAGGTGCGSDHFTDVTEWDADKHMSCFRPIAFCKSKKVIERKACQ